ncbi:hypothetical protein FKG94_15755 [Exilibacterium tricleocarpae]|uniref:LysR substrate-binding domain-containing protein n=1 Tax=Exilibacterium tricleocarpae TaxID=2591008 RepID=A0A545TFR5_9GAMM|nr:hypothetical protein FKG94_15755 [Exilibacterium tricleocarpae]
MSTPPHKASYSSIDCIVPANITRGGALNTAQVNAAIAATSAAIIESGRLQSILPQLRPPSMPVSVLFTHNRQLSPRVKVFIDWLTALFE